MKRILALAICAFVAISSVCGQAASLNQTAAGAEKTLYAVLKDGKTGYIDVTGKMIVQPIYDKAKPSLLPHMKEGRIAFIKDGKWGVLDGNGKIVIPAKYDKILSFKNGIAKIEKKPEGSTSYLLGKWGFVDKDGVELVAPEHDLPAFSTGASEGYFRYADKATKTQGYKAITGDCPIKEKFNVTGDFRMGVAPVKKTRDGLYGYIDKQGKWVIEPTFAYAEALDKNGIAQVAWPDKTWGTLDRNLKVRAKGLTYTKTELIWNFFKDGLMMVTRDGKYGFINDRGEEVIPLKYNWGASGGFSDGLAVMNKGGKIVKGKWGLESVEGGTWIIIDASGQELKTLTGYEGISSFSEGIAIYKKNGKYGYMNIEGKEVTKPEWVDRPAPFTNGLGRFYVRAAGDNITPSMLGYVNKNGKIVWPAAK